MPQLQQIISSCLTQTNMDQQTFFQLIKALNIPFDNYIYDPNIFLLFNEKLKSKLYDIIKSEGKNYIDYLRLPKFFVLKSQTKNKLIMLLDAIWQQYSLLLTNEKEQQYYRESVNSMLPQFISLQDIQNYHLQNFARLKLNKTNSNSSQPLPNPHRNIAQHVNPFGMQPQSMQMDPLLTGFHRPVMGNPFYHAKIDGDFSNGMGRLFGETGSHLTGQWMEKTQPQGMMQQHLNNIIQSSHMNTFIDPNQPHNISSNSIFPIPNSHPGVKQQNYQHPKQLQAQQQSPQQQKLKPTPYNKPLSSIQSASTFSQAKSNNLMGNRNNKDSQKASYIRNCSNNIIEQVDTEKRDLSQEQAKLVHITGADDELSEKIRHYQFIQCPCEGNINNIKKTNSSKSLLSHQSLYFECKLCRYYFHYQCLNITDEAVKVDICPCCKLKQGSNIFVKIHPEAFGKRWCRMNIKQKLSMFLTERQILKMKEIKRNVKSNSILQYQLRFLKIPNNTQKSALSNQNKKPFPTNNSDLKKFNNLPLPSGYIEKIQPYNVFEISLRSGEVKASGSTPEDEECLYIFGIFMIERYSEAQITEELFSQLNENNSVGEEYLYRYLIDPAQGLQIKLVDPTSQQPIRYPVRGENCQHPEVFDCMSILQYYKQYGEKLSQQHCPVCEVEYRKMVVDRFLYGKLREISAGQQRQAYERLRYYGGSRVQFLSEQEEQESQKERWRNNEDKRIEQEQMGNNQQQQSSQNSGNNNEDGDDDDSGDSQSLSC